MDQSEARHLHLLPVVECEQLAFTLPPTAHELEAAAVARLLAEHATSEPAPMPPAVRERLAALRGAGAQPMAGPPAPEARRRAAALLPLQSAEWSHADRRARAMLTNWAGLRARHPGKSMHELADRAWGEIPEHERAELASAVRVIQRLLAKLARIGAFRG